MTLGMPALSLLSYGRSVFARPLPPLLLGLAPTASTASTAIRNYARVSKSTSASTSASTAKRKGKGKGIVDPTKKVSASSPSKTEGRKRARYQLRPPRYYRGPLHPHQPPPPWSPNSREFVPGPFGRERLQDHYYNTVASDLLLLTYTHIPPGTVRKKRDIKQRLREWDDSSPYHKNRPLRGPRGGGPLRLLTEPRTFRNVPALTGVTLHTMVKEALSDSGHLAVAGMVLQAISGVRARIGFARKSVAPFSLRAGRAVSARVHLQGPLAYRFVASLIDVVMPRIKEYRGVKASSGDSSGNIALGFAPNHVILFPEIEVNYDMYPPKMVPGIHVMLHTSATNDKDARMLLQGFGVPFHGKPRD